MHKRFLFLVAFELVGLVALSVVLQLLYPAGRLLPFVRINGQDFGGQTVSNVAARLDATYAKAHVQIQADGALTLVPLEEVGLDVSATPTANTAAMYSIRQRLIPFSAVMVMIGRDTPMQARIDKERVQYFAQQFEKQSTIAAVNAQVRVSGGVVSMLPAKPKQTFLAATIYQAIIGAKVTPDIKIAPTPVVTSADIPSSAAQAMQAQAQSIIDTPLQLTVGSTPVTVDKQVVASWLDFPVADRQMQLTFKDDLVQQYVSTIQTSMYRAPTATRIVILDGRETSRVVGVNGSGIDIAAAARQIESYLRSSKSAALALNVTALAPGLTYDHQYSDTNAGLTSLLTDLSSGKDYGLAIIEKGGKARSANVNGGKVYVAASTYKLFISYALFQLIDNGEMHWNDTINGLTADACFQKMIINSDNPCANAFGDRIGWARVTSMAAGLGLTSTHVEKGNNSTTANDLALFLSKLQDGTLLHADHQNQLISYMKQQIYRKGIPAGTGVAVADKVGFVDNVLHDAGIVYAPGHTYIMVIMTSGGSWTSIADVAHQVQAYLTL